jgi:hypothetical protein
LNDRRELNRIEQEMSNYVVICFGIILIAAMYTVLCIIFWQISAGLSNQIDNDPGLPAIYDAFMLASIVLVDVMSLTAVYSIIRWVPKKKRFNPLKKKSIWDGSPKNRIWDRRAGPPATKGADKQ